MDMCQPYYHGIILHYGIKGKISHLLTINNWVLIVNTQDFSIGYLVSLLIGLDVQVVSWLHYIEQHMLESQVLLHR